MPQQMDPRITEHLGALSRVAGVYARSAAERDDLMQEILVAAWRAMPAFRGECSALTFLLRVAHNRAISWAARRRPFEPEVEAAVAPDAEGGLALGARREALARAVRALPDGQRQVVALALEGLSHGAIASVLGISENNVAVRLNRARGTLRAALGGDDV